MNYHFAWTKVGHHTTKQISSLAFLFLLAGSAFGQQQSEYLYVTANSINGFRMNLGTGALTRIPGASLAVLGYGAVAPPAGNFLFIAGPSGITVAAIDPATGALTIVPGSPFSPALQSFALTITPNGRFLYATSGFGIYKFTVDGNVGEVTQTGPPISLENQFGALTLSPGGKFLYAGPLAVFSTTPLFGFSVDPGTGNLTPIPLEAVGSSPVITPNGSYLYSVTQTIFGDTQIIAYAIDQASGVLTPIAGSPFSAFTGYPGGISLDRKGNFLYQPFQNVTAGGLAGYTIKTANGALAGSVPGSPFATASSPGLFVLDDSNRFGFTDSFISYSQESITEFSLNATTGSLTALPTTLNVAGSPGFTFVVPKPASTASLTKLTLEPANPTVTSLVTTKQFIAEGAYSDGTLRFLTASVSWSSTSPNVATISNTPGQKGLATIVSPGQTTITATLNGLTANSTLIVSQ